MARWRDQQAQPVAEPLLERRRGGVATGGGGIPVPRSPQPASDPVATLNRLLCGAQEAARSGDHAKVETTALTAIRLVSAHSLGWSPTQRHQALKALAAMCQQATA